MKSGDISAEPAAGDKQDQHVPRESFTDTVGHIAKIENSLGLHEDAEVGEHD